MPFVAPKNYEHNFLLGVLSALLYHGNQLLHIDFHQIIPLFLQQNYHIDIDAVVYNSL